MCARRVTSTANPQLKGLAELKERRGRERTGTFIVEGHREALAAARAGYEVLRLIYAPELAGEDALTELVAAVGEVGDSLELSANAFAKLSLRQNPDGVALQVRARATGLQAIDLASASLVLVVDGVEKPGNLGALLRSADAVGVDGVVVTGTGTDIYNPNVIRASQGSVFALDVMSATPGALLAAVRAAGLGLVVATPAAERDYWDADLKRNVAIVLGAEDFGVSSELAAAADVSVRVPMRATLADSLNVSVAGALLLYEALRQRTHAAQRTA